MASTQSTPTPTVEQHQHYEVSSLSDDSKRKLSASKRATTAERRATHNAVERARRETLNGRFLLLASLLPNLTQIRRPSKSAIVNSSIAHVHASRRHRLLASRVAQDLLRENEDMRREINEWRERAGIRPLQQRMRGEGFGMIVRAELEPISISAAEDEDDEDYNMHEEINMFGRPAVQNVPMMQRPPMMQRHTTHVANVHPIVVNASANVHYDPAHPANMHGMPAFTTSPPQHHHIPSAVAPAPAPQPQMQHQHAPHPPHINTSMIAPQTPTLPSPQQQTHIHSPNPSHHASVDNFNHGSSDPHQQFLHTAPQSHDNSAEKAWSMGYAAAHSLAAANALPPWSDDSSSASSNSARPHSGDFSSYQAGLTPPTSPSDMELNTNTASMFDFGAYDASTGYDYAPSHSSSSAGSEGSFVPRGMTLMTTPLSSPAVLGEQHHQQGFGMMPVV